MSSQLHDYSEFGPLRPSLLPPNSVISQEPTIHTAKSDEKLHAIKPKQLM
jgi:hypothetical protein